MSLTLSLRRSMVIAAMAASVVVSSCSLVGSGTYKPPFLPVEFIIDTLGNITVQADASLTTPLGDFSVGGSAEQGITAPNGGLVLFVQRIFNGQPLDAGYQINEDSDEKILTIDDDITIRFTGQIRSIDAKYHHKIVLTSPGALPQATPVYQDPLTSDPNNAWPEDSICYVQQDGLHLNTMNVSHGVVCWVPVDALANGIVTVQVNQAQGSGDEQGYGLVVRGTSDQANNYGYGYSFDIFSDGSWGFWADASTQSGTDSTVVEPEQSDAINTGSSNTLSILMQDSHFTFYINGKGVGQADDSTYTSAGLIGLIANPGVEAVFSNLTVSSL